MIRAVLDANVFVSALLSPNGIPAKVLAAWRDERFQLVVSPAILDEIGRVLHYPRIARRHRWSEESVSTLLEDLAHLAILTPGRVRLAVIREDPSDNRYLECPVEGEAAFIVSGDDHLLRLRGFQDIEVITPGVFLAALKMHRKS